MDKPEDKPEAELIYNHDQKKAYLVILKPPKTGKYSINKGFS